MAIRLIANRVSFIKNTPQTRFIQASKSLITKRSLASTAEFEAAKERLGKLKNDPGNETKLTLYALFKQATVGQCNTKKPGMMDFVGKAKWDSWNNLKDLSQDEARSRYVKLVSDLCSAEQSSSDTVSTPSHSSTADIVFEVKDNMQVITLNRPLKKNALTIEMYDQLSEQLVKIGQDTNTSLAVVTGAGDYFSSGNDLSNFMRVDPSNIKEFAATGRVTLDKFVSSLIDFPKPLIAVVNGPAVGICTTMLGLFDIVYASDKATFHTPFTSLGQSPEGCSSYIFPKVMGAAKANEMLLFNKKITAQQACDWGLVTEVYKDGSVDSIWNRIKEYSKLPKNSLRLTKTINRSQERTLLHEVSKRECELLVERWVSDECINAVMKFFQGKTKV